MKKSALTVLLAVLLLLTSCASRQLARGRWEDRVYYNEYGRFQINVNSYFTIYDDRAIKDDIGAVYASDYVLNDMVISSDYCALIVTMEKTQNAYTREEYANQFIENTKNNVLDDSCAMADPFDETIAGRTFTCVPVRYTYPTASGGMYYYEYNFITDAEDNVFIVLRVSAGSEENIAAALGMIKEY